MPDPAATVVVLRPQPDGFQVLLVERNSRGFFGSLHVFPGGRVEAADLAPGSNVADEAAHRRAARRELAEETGIDLSEDSLMLISRWVTPVWAPRRFDTRFYVASCPDPPEVVLDRDELVGHSWVTPAEALRHHAEGRWMMMLPTLAHLRWLARRSSIDDALASAQGADGRTLVRPQVLDDGSIVPVLVPEAGG